MANLFFQESQNRLGRAEEQARILTEKAKKFEGLFNDVKSKFTSVETNLEKSKKEKKVHEKSFEQNISQIAAIG